MVTKNDIKYFRRLSRQSYFIRFNIEMCILMILIIAFVIFFLFETKKYAERDGKTYQEFFQLYLQKNAEEKYKSMAFDEAVENLGHAWTGMLIFAVLLGVWCHHSVHIKRCQRILSFIETHPDKFPDSPDKSSPPKA